MLARSILFFAALLMASVTVMAGPAQSTSPANAQETSPLLQRLDGKMQSGTMLVGKTKPGITVRLNDRPVRVSEQGDFVFGFGRDVTGKQELELIDAQGNRENHTLDIAARQWNIQRVDGVPARTVKPPSEETLKRIRKETAQVVAARKTDSNRLDYLTDFILPAEGPITGVYGSQRVYNGVPKRPHYGLDIAGPVGTPVVAPAAGVITLVHPDMFYSGGTLIMDHGFGISSTFIHLSKVLVEEGQEVQQGELIAEMGAGGRATGSHLDWRINWYAERLDPAFLVQLPENESP